RLAQQQLADAGAVGGVGDVNVGKLMVADGEGTALERLEDLAERAGADAEKAGPAEHAIDEDRALNIAVTVFTDDPDPSPGGPGGIEQRGAGRVQLADQPRQVRS